MATKKGLDGFFMKYGITEMDLQIIKSVCQAADVDSDWLEEEILAKYQEHRKNISKDEKLNEAVYKSMKKALEKL